MEYKRGIPAYTDAEGNTYGLLVETKESCITDDDGKNLKDKLTEMHVVKSPDKITFKSQDGSTVAIAEPKNGLNIQGILNATGGLNVSQGTNLETTNIKNLLPFNFLGPDGDRKFRWFLDGNNVLKLQFFYNSRWNELFYFTNDGLLHLTSDIFFDVNSKGVHFRNSSNNANSFKILTTERNTLEAQVYVNGIWTGAIQVNSDSSINILQALVAQADFLFLHGHEIRMYNDTSIRFNNPDNTYQNFEFYSSPSATDSSWVLRYKTTSSSKWAYGVALHPNGVFEAYGDLKVDGNIVAPNIATTAALAAAERSITEQDLEIIETQQSVTEQDISNIETQQLITEMDLERIGGQVA